MDVNLVAILRKPLVPFVKLTAIFGLSLLPPAAPIAAQSMETTENRAAEVCMSRTVPTDMNTAEVQAVLPASSAPFLRARGYRFVACAETFPSADTRRLWRDRICALASEPNEFFQEQTERALGVRAATLCGMAEMIAGPWQRQGARN